MPVSGFTMLRRQLGRELRRLRLAADISEQQVDDELGLPSRTTLWRLETGKVSIKVGTVLALCRFYKASAEETDTLATRAPGTAERGWWEEYGDITPAWFGVYVGLEGAASQIITYEGQVVPGELQTPAYTRAVYQAAQPDDGEAVIARHVALRRERHEALLKRRTPLRVVLDEAVLTRPVGGAEVLREQIEYLRELDARDHIDIRVLTWEVGAHQALAGAFRVLDFEDPDDPDVAYIEAQLGARYLETPAEVGEYRRIFEAIYGQATPLKEYKNHAERH